jgi:hypothetical protein
LLGGLDVGLVGSASGQPDHVGQHPAALGEGEDVAEDLHDPGVAAHRMAQPRPSSRAEHRSDTGSDLGGIPSVALHHLADARLTDHDQGSYGPCCGLVIVAASQIPVL